MKYLVCLLMEMEGEQFRENILLYNNTMSFVSFGSQISNNSTIEVLLFYNTYIMIYHTRKVLSRYLYRF